MSIRCPASIQAVCVVRETDVLPPCHESVPQEEYIRQYGDLLKRHGEAPVTVTRVESVEEVLKEADVSMTHNRFPDVFLLFVRCESSEVLAADLMVAEGGRRT